MDGFLFEINSKASIEAREMGSPLTYLVETTGLDLINVWLGPYPASNSPPDCCI